MSGRENHLFRCSPHHNTHPMQSLYHPLWNPNNWGNHANRSFECKWQFFFRHWWSKFNHGFGMVVSMKVESWTFHCVTCRKYRELGKPIWWKQYFRPRELFFFRVWSHSPKASIYVTRTCAQEERRSSRPLVPSIEVEYLSTLYCKVSPRVYVWCRVGRSTCFCVLA